MGIFDELSLGSNRKFPDHYRKRERAIRYSLCSFTKHNPSSSMKPLSIIAIAISILFSSQAMQAASVADLAKAQAIIHKVNELVEKYREMTIELEAPKSMANSNGKYVLQFNDDGELTGWANKALEAQAGVAVGEKAGSAVGKA